VANPTTFDFADWFSVVATAILSGVGGAMAWFNSTKKEINRRLESVEDSMSGHDTNLAVLQTCQENTEKRLDEIGETTRDTNQSLKDLSQTMTQALLALQGKKPT
jgi:hypothetical protein